MYGLPEPPIIEEGEKEKLVASISISLEPPEGTGGPFITISYEISLRMFFLVLALTKLEKKNKEKAEKDKKIYDKDEEDKKEKSGSNEKNTKDDSNDDETIRRKRNGNDTDKKGKGKEAAREKGGARKAESADKHSGYTVNSEKRGDNAAHSNDTNI